jgi:proteasome lid subunit RPN8/RPN11
MMNPNLQINRVLFKRIVRCARRFAPDECVGLLARRSLDRSGRVTACCLLPALATPGKAEAAPLDISSAAGRLWRRGLVPVGIWHSHGTGGVHHSLQDDETIARILPAMALENYQRPVTWPLVPFVTAPDLAELPLPDGTTLHFNLLGPPLPGSDARERMAWSSIATRFRQPALVPRAVVRTGALHLVGGPVVLSLGLPPGCSVESQVVDRAPLRSARLYSLVVNSAGLAYAVALTVHDIDGASLIQHGPCPIETFGKRRARATQTGGPEAGIPAPSKRAHRCEDPAMPGHCRVPEAEDDHDRIRSV